MITLARVLIWNKLVGAVAWNTNRNYATFEFDADFLKKDLDLSPIKMPLKEAKHGKHIFSFQSLNKETYKGLPGLLADSLPDKFGNKMIDAWLAQHGRLKEGFNPVERLCYTGKRGMGALEYEPMLVDDDEKSNPVEIKELVSLARIILDSKKKLSADFKKNKSKGLSEIIRVGTSAGGARAKGIIAYNEKTGEVRSGQIENENDFEYWIIKFDGVTNEQLGDPKGYGKIEYAYYLMAIAAGIDMMPSKVLKESNRSHFMTKRFDREGLKKIHSQTLCALAHFDYNDAYSNSYEQAFQIMRQLKLPYKEMEELFRRMVFNVIARNQDDHTKNISFLMNEKGQWSLSPAYDITYAYDPQNKWMKAHQMSINGKNEDITKADLLALAANMNIKKAAVIIESVVEAVSQWTQFAKKAEVNVNQIPLIRKTFKLKL